MISSGALEKLQQYSACDIADILLRLETTDNGAPRAGFLADIEPRNITKTGNTPVVGPAFTVLFHSKYDSEFNPDVSTNIAQGQQWSDMIKKDSIVVVKQPDGQRCAAVGGHHAARVSKLGAKALLVSGRIRDRSDMDKICMPIWSRGTSVVGAGAESKPQAVQVPVEIDGILVQPGDLVFLDPSEGAVRIPGKVVDKVLDSLLSHVESEAKVRGMIADGHSVQESFAKCR